MTWIVNNWQFLLSCLSLCVGLGFTIYNVVTRVKALKNAKTEQERLNLLDEIKDSVHGLIDVAEVTFSDIKKSGPSKLLYVLNNIETLCEELGLTFDEEYWTNFVNKLIANINHVTEDKENEKKTKELIEEVKSKIAQYVDSANQLFKNVPLSKEYKVDYVLRLIKTECEKLSINVYEDYDWSSLVKEYFKED